MENGLIVKTVAESVASPDPYIALGVGGWLGVQSYFTRRVDGNKGVKGVIGTLEDFCGIGIIQFGAKK